MYSDAHILVINLMRQIIIPYRAEVVCIVSRADGERAQIAVLYLPRSILDARIGRELLAGLSLIHQTGLESGTYETQERHDKEAAQKK